MGRLEIRQPERLPVELEAVPQNVKSALEVELLDQRVQQQCLQPRPVQSPHLRPRLRLRLLQERKDPRREQRPLHVPFRGVALVPPAPAQEDLCDIGLEGSFRGLSHIEPLTGLFLYISSELMKGK